MDLNLNLNQVAKMQDDARALARAAGYLGRAAGELAPVAAPVARDAIVRAPGRFAKVAARVRALTPEKLRERQTVAAIVAGVAAAGLTAATVAHFAHRRKVTAAYKEQKRAEEAARQQVADRERVLEESPFSCTAGEFLEATGASEGERAEEFAALSAPGCFAVVAYEDEPDRGGYARFRDVYVGASKDMAAGAAKQLEGRGNLYVHADVVYGQPLRVFFFPCEAHEVYARKEGLVRALGAEGSYNKISEIADLD